MDDQKSEPLSVSAVKPTLNRTDGEENGTDITSSKDMVISESSKERKTVSFKSDHEGMSAKVQSAMLGQRKLGPVGRKYQSRRRKGSQTHTLVSTEQSAKETINDGVKQTDREESRQPKWNWLFFWKKSDESNKENELSLVNVSVNAL